MTDRQLDQIFKRAASGSTSPSSLGGGVMARVRADDGRERRWRVWIQMTVGAALMAGLVAAVSIGWSQAAKDDTHKVPPPMPLFGEGARP